MRENWKVCGVVVAGLVALVLAEPTLRFAARWHGKRIHKELEDAKHRLERDPSDTKARRVILDHLEGGHSFGRMWACTTIENLGPKAAWALPWMIKALQSEDSSVRREAPRAIGAMGEAAAPAVPHLIRHLRTSNDYDSRVFSVEALGEIGEPAVPAIPVIEGCVTNWDLRIALTRHFSG